MNTQVQTNPQLPALGRELLRKVMDKKITMEEFHRECAYWATGDLSSMYYKTNNLEKPLILKDYEERRQKDSSYTVAREFWERPEIKEYSIISHKVLSENHANWHWLHYLKKYIPKEDTVNHARIIKVISSYPHHREIADIDRRDWQ